MITTKPITITVSTVINVPLEKAWKLWTLPEHITRWNQASADWCCPRAENDLKEGGTFRYRMEARDGSFGFDFGGTYKEVKPMECISYTLDDGRSVMVRFQSTDGQTTITESFEAETIHSEELQRGGWQAILDSFKHYAESTPDR